jgi:hypothetical protein
MKLQKNKYGTRSKLIDGIFTAEEAEKVLQLY